MPNSGRPWPGRRPSEARSMGRSPGGRRAAVFLDRDGVINRSSRIGGKPYAPRRLGDFRLLPGVAAAVADLKRAGFLIIVVTNQPDVGNGLTTRETLDAMHAKLSKSVAVDAILVCPHRQDAGCSCRKPKPGLLRRGIQDFAVDPSCSYMIGDRWSDIAAGRAANLYSIFIDRGYAEALHERPDLVVTSLPRAVQAILATSPTGGLPGSPRSAMA
jgi:D-glycero-D-manno-heptose 1,7-bisphosphate phosphatase